MSVLNTDDQNEAARADYLRYASDQYSMSITDIVRAEVLLGAGPDGDGSGLTLWPESESDHDGYLCKRGFSYDPLCTGCRRELRQAMGFE